MGSYEPNLLRVNAANLTGSASELLALDGTEVPWTINMKRKIYL